MIFYKGSLTIWTNSHVVNSARVTGKPTFN